MDTPLPEGIHERRSLSASLWASQGFSFGFHPAAFGRSVDDTPPAFGSLRFDGLPGASLAQRQLHPAGDGAGVHPPGPAVAGQREASGRLP